MALTEFFILRKPRSGCLEERTAPIQPMPYFFTRSSAGHDGRKQLKQISLLRDIGGKHPVPTLPSARRRNPRRWH
jgi:hypothetical protein